MLNYFHYEAFEEGLSKYYSQINHVRSEDLERNKRKEKPSSVRITDELVDHGFKSVGYERLSYASGKVVVAIDTFPLKEDPFCDHSRRLWQIFTLPQHRGEGHAMRAIEQIVYCAELSGCSIVSIARPFKLRHVKEDTTAEEVADQMGRSWGIDYDDDATSKGMRYRFDRAGFSTWNAAGERGASEELLVEDTYIYIPRSADKDFAKRMNPKIVKENKSDQIRKLERSLCRRQVRRGPVYG